MKKQIFRIFNTIFFLFSAAATQLKVRQIIQSGTLKKHHVWKNIIKNQIVQPLQYHQPESLEDIITIVKSAESHNCCVRAIGSGHSFTDITQTPDYLISTERLNRWIELDVSLLKSNVDPKFLKHVESGMKIYELNEHLDKRGFALINMGGYDGQSIVGAMSTGTHGSGIKIGPLDSFYKSITLIASGGKQYRIEPENGITDPLKYRNNYPNDILIQNDEWFNTVTVSMGCVGIIFSVIIEVRLKFWLKEVRELKYWDEVKAIMRKGDIFYNNEHFEVLVNPYPINNKHTCLITTRNNVPEPDGPITDKNRRNFLSELLGLIPGVHLILKFLSRNFAHVFPKLIETALKGLVDDSYINKSYKVFNIGTANYVSAYASEIAIPISGDLYIDAVEKIFELAEKMRSVGQVYHISPFSLRFVKASDSYLSMMNGQDSCMIEISVANGSFSGFEMLERYEKELMQFKMRPHWGMINFLSGSNDLIKKLYPHFDKWLEVYKQLNKNGTFDNRFTQRCGFSEYKLPT